MADIAKPSEINLIWSSGGDVVSPGSAKYAAGWLTEIPPRQWFNYIDNKQDQAIAHINQHGIAVWDSVTEYQAGKSFVTGSNGKVYVAVTTNTNNNPTTDVSETNWADVFKSGIAIVGSTSSWTVPPILKLGIKKARVTVIGGGGAGGGAASTASYNAAGGGGGAGGLAIEILDLTGVSTVSVTIGAGGVGTASGVTPGTAGGTTSFGAYCTATGGAFGNPATASPTSSGIGTGNEGGLGVGADINARGGAGQGGDAGAPSIAGASVAAGIGGGSFYSGGQRAGSPGYGAGGSGAGTLGGSQTLAGQNGAAGVVIIEW